MAITPDEALLASRAAHLTQDEFQDVEDAVAQTDKHLSTNWNGTFTSIDLPGDLSVRVLGELVRRYSRAGWDVQLQPIQSNVQGPRGVVVLRGARLTFVPRWKPTGLQTPVLPAEEPQEGAPAATELDAPPQKLRALPAPGGAA